jgi:hypothetical protein
MRTSLAFALLLFAGCDDDVVPRRDLGSDLAVGDLAAADLQGGDLAGGGDLGAISLAAAVRAHPDNVVSALVDVTVSGADRVWVEAGDTLAYGQPTPAVTLAGASATLTIPVIGLRAGATNHLRVVASAGSGPSLIDTMTADLPFDAGPIPTDFPSFNVTTNAAPVDGYLLVSPVGDPGGFGAAVMIDRAGRILWYRRNVSTNRGVEFQRAATGNFVVFQIAGPLFEELTLTGATAHTWQSPAPLGTDGHDLVYLANRHVLLLGWDKRSIDSRPYFDAGVPDALMVDNTIDELDPDGGVAFHWASWPQIGPGELYKPEPVVDPSNFELLHPNALSLAPDGNLLVSFRATSSIMKIDRTTGAILWRLGGDRSDFTLVNDPLGGFSKQHDARFLANGDLMLLDNGNDHPPAVRETRVVQYRLDEANRTATLVWQYRHDPSLFSFAAGSARRVSNGDTIVTFAFQGIITQVDPFSTVKWEMAVKSGFKPEFVYRAIPVPTLYP